MLVTRWFVFSILAYGRTFRLFVPGRGASERRKARQMNVVSTMTPWYQPIRDTHNRYFRGPDPQTTWQEHLAALNGRYASQLGGRHLMNNAPSLPPPWFIGDIERVRDNPWVLIISINPKIDATDTDRMQEYLDRAFTPDTYWDECRLFQETRHWNQGFVSAFARLAAMGLGEDPPTGERALRRFATDRILFVEACPYASDGSPLDEKLTVLLSHTDPGFKIAADVRRQLIERGRPRFFLVNGIPAGKALESTDRGRIHVERQGYVSVDGNRRWHTIGRSATPSGDVPFVGFPFLRRSNTHNSLTERDELGKRIAAYVTGGARSSP